MLTQGSIARGGFFGAGADKTISCGFIPDFVMLVNARGSTEMLALSGVYQILKFDSGSSEIVVGDAITEASNGGTADVVHVALTSGTWAGGDAAGWLALKNVAGTIANNADLNINANDNRAGVSNAATADGTPIGVDMDIDSEAGTPTGEWVKPYDGTSGGNAPGFIVDATAAVSGEFIQWIAFRADNHIWG